MKKSLLFSVLAMMGVVSASAFNDGEYIYTPDSKYKTVTGNLISNGDFSSQFKGWTNGSDESAVEPSTDAWELIDGVGPNGETVASSKTGTTGSVMARIWSVAELGGPGTYVYSYYIQGAAEGNTSNAAGGANYVGAYINTTGTYAQIDRTVSDPAAITTEWVLVSDTVQFEGDEQFFVFYTDRIAEGTRITNVSINKVEQVFDDRLVADKKAYIESLLANGWLTEGLDDLLGGLQELYASFYEDMSPEEGADNLEVVDGLVEEFLAANSASMMGNFTHWNTTSSKCQAGTTKIGDWVFTGGRWFHCNSNDSDTREAMREISSIEIQRTYDLPGSTATVTKTWEPGKYFMYVDVTGYYRLTSSSDQYAPDLNSEVKGCTIFGNDQTLELGTLDTRKNKRYVIFFEIPESQAGVEGNVKFGFDYTIPEDEVGVKRGGYIALSNLRVRRIGLSEEQLAHLNLVKDIATAQNSLKVMIDSAKVVATKTDIYKWGMVQMNDSTAKGEAEYIASLAKVDANGKEVLVNDVDDAAYPTTLKAYMNIVRKGMQNVYGYCQPYFNLVEAVEENDAKLANPVNANGDAALKSTLQAIISESKALIASYAVLEDHETIVAEGEKYTEKLALLNEAAAAYFATTASYSNPSAIAITNGDFSTGNYSGWTFTETVSGKETFKKSVNDSYSNGLCLAVGRGYTASPQSKLVQDVKLTDKGLYMYKAKAHAMNTVPGNDLGMADIIEADIDNGIVADTIYTGEKNKVHLLFGAIGYEDSVAVHSRMIEYNYSYKKNDWNGQQDYGYVAGTYAIFVEKTDDTEADYELGMYTYGQIDGAGANIYGFGDNNLLFLGNTEKAFADIKADVATRLAEDKALLTANENSEEQQVINLVSRLSRRLADAEALAAGSVTTTKELTALVNATYFADELAAKLQMITGIDTVSADVVKSNIAKGVYNLSGMKVANDQNSFNKLPKGLYIFNGKKYVVK